MRVLVTGSRNWTDPEPIRRELEALRWTRSPRPDGTHWMSGIVVIHGGAHGADLVAGMIANKMGFEVISVPAQWEKYGTAAGPRRNEQMLREFGPIDLVLAFHEDLAKSKGTKDCVNRAIRDGIRVVIVSKPRKPGYGSKLSRTLSA